MSLLQVSQLAFSYPGGDALFRGVGFEVNPGDRIALIGPNGAGKTTLLAILADRIEATNGRVIRRRGLRIATMDTAGAGDGRVDRILYGLGMDPADLDKPLAELSAGQRAKVRLADALTSGADLLLLDEPTNHLDLDALEWVERELARLDSALLVVSHDRRFLQSVPTRTFEIRRGRFTEYGGGYDHYLDARQKSEQRHRLDYEAQQRRMASFERAAAKRDKLSAKVATAPEGARLSHDFYRRKAAKVARTGRLLRERELHEDRIDKPFEEQAIPQLDFHNVPRSGVLTFDAESVGKRYGATRALDGFSLRCLRGERVALCGSNGSGKSTLLRLIAGIETADEGRLTLGSNVAPGYYAQEAENLLAGGTRTALDVLLEETTDQTYARTILACLKLPRDRVLAPVAELSLGERSKVALARLLVGKTNLLLLDEPTNHLELEALNALEETLQRYPGTILFVSHDRWFIERVAQRVVELKPAD